MAKVRAELKWGCTEEAQTTAPSAVPTAVQRAGAGFRGKAERSTPGSRHRRCLPPSLGVPPENPELPLEVWVLWVMSKGMTTYPNDYLHGGA